MKKLWIPLFAGIFLPVFAQAVQTPQSKKLVATKTSSTEVARSITLGPATAVRPIPNGVDVQAGRAVLRVVAIDDATIRVRVALDNSFPADNSFAVMKEALTTLKPSAAPKLSNSAGVVELATKEVRVRIEKPTMRVIFMDKDGSVISEDDPNHPAQFTAMSLESATKSLKSSFIDPAKASTKKTISFKVSKLMPEDEDYFGLGDKAGPLNHRNQAFTMWNTDAFGWQESTDPLYKTIPFFVGLRNGTSYGIFLDNTYRTSFDFGKSSRDSYSFGSDDGQLDYYFFYGPHPKKVIERYTALTGRTPLPPMWTMGYQQCRYSYFPEARVREIADTFRAKKIPVDAIYLDIDYQLGNAPFTVDRAKFPTFEGMVSDLSKQGIKTILITDMHLKYEPGSMPYETGMKGDHFVKNPDGSVYIGPVWPGPSVFPDFTRGASTRQWWGSLYKDFVDKGVKGFWNDMNEPSVFERKDKTMPLDAVHRVAMPDGSERLTDHREIHNVYGMENVHATYEGMLRLQPDKRPFVLTRAVFAGGQRYAATWTGDNSSSWNHMRMSIANLLNMGISGYANVGNDIGGFWGNPRPEVLTRWHQIGTFNPIYRNHTTKGSADQEPWVHGAEHEAIRKKYIELRYRLMPYIYSAFEENTRTGVPVMRAMFLEFPEMGGKDEEYMFGRDILVAPGVWEFLPDYEVELPRGGWYDYWTGKGYEGNKKLTVQSTYEDLPLYVRAGAIIPQMPVVQNLDEIPQGPLELRVYSPGSNIECGGSLYQDDGLSYAFKRGEENYLRLNFSCAASTNGLSINAAQKGAFKPWWKQVQVQVYGAKAAHEVVAGGSNVPNSFDAKNGTLTFTIPAEALQQGIKISY